MSDNWDDDDYDPNAQLAAQASDKIATLGLDEVIREQQQQKQAGSASHQSGHVDEGNNNRNAGAEAKPFGTDRELNEREKREAQLRSDAAAGMDLFGISAERKEPTFDDLQTKADFQAFADKLGEQIAPRHSHAQYLLFVNTLVDHLTKPMTKVQLHSVRDVVQTHLDAHLKREEEEQKRKQEEQQQKDSKKAKKKQVLDDYVDDEYDDYDEKFNRY